MPVEEHTITLAGSPVFYRSADAAPGGATTVFVHGAPGSSDDWISLLERTGGIAPDLIGFGRTGKGGHLDYTPEGLADFLEDLLGELGVGRLNLVLHGWGAAGGVILAARRPASVERLVLLNPVPLLEGLSWPWWARLWRVPVLGELAMGFTTPAVLKRGLRRGSATATAWPEERLAEVWEQFDQGTQRAILRLQRAVDDERLQAMARALRTLRLPALVVWGERDPWWRREVAQAYVSQLPDAQLELASGAGHWPWLDDPGVVDRVAAFVQPPGSR